MEHDGSSRNLLYPIIPILVPHSGVSSGNNLSSTLCFIQSQASASTFLGLRQHDLAETGEVPLGPIRLSVTFASPLHSHQLSGIQLR